MLRNKITKVLRKLTSGLIYNTLIRMAELKANRLSMYPHIIGGELLKVNVKIKRSNASDVA